MKCENCGHQFASTEPNPSCPTCGSGLVFETLQEQGNPAGSNSNWQAQSNDGAPQSAEGPRGCPWERRQSFTDVNALIATIKMVAAEPHSFHRQPPLPGDTASPLSFAVIVGTIGGAMGGLWQGLFGSFGDKGADVQLGVMTGILIGVVIALPFLTALGAYISAGLYHLGLMAVGGANRPFESTFRVVCYNTFPTLLGIIPLCGGVIGGIWSIYLNAIGLSQAHGISTGKALLAIFLPLLLLCGCGLMLFLGIFGTAFFAYLAQMK